MAAHLPVWGFARRIPWSLIPTKAVARVVLSGRWIDGRQPRGPAALWLDHVGKEKKERKKK
jgi:hypothetical protein